MSRNLKLALTGLGVNLMLFGSALAQTQTDLETIDTEEAARQLEQATKAAAVASTGVVAFAIGWIIFWVIVGGIGVILWLWALIDVIRREFPAGSSDKVVWILIVLLIPWIGPIVYLIAGRKKGTIPGAPAEPKT